jgi:hypothetical protein
MNDRGLNVYATNHDVRHSSSSMRKEVRGGARSRNQPSTKRVLVGADKTLGQGPPKIDAPGIYIIGP